MTTSVGTKARKKQSSLSTAPVQHDAVPVKQRQFENALLSMENACVRVLEGQPTGERQNTERRYWQQRFKNIATPVSLALAECKGPRRFHYHYRHRSDDDSVLHPVMMEPLATLAQVCKQALTACHDQMVGIEDDAITDMRDMFETALAGFMELYREQLAE